MSTSKLRIAHTPDADDAFMFAGLVTGAVRIPNVQIEWVLEDVQSLNQRALKGELDAVAVSAGAYPLISNHYWILSAGASVGRNYGPVLVAATPRSLSPTPDGRLDLQGLKVATPGQHTTAAMLLFLYADHFQPVPTSFEQVIPAVREGRADLGVVIHEGQITFQNHGLTKVLDLGQQWARETQLPIPLGLEVVRKELGNALAHQINKALKESILWAQSHRDLALRHALQYARGVEPAVLERFIKMYVNEDTLNLGAQGKTALETLFKKAQKTGLLSSAPRVEIIED